MPARVDSLDAIEIPLIRTKRSHRKSRGGCLRCKKRRVKCDEQRPACTSCIIRASECTYGSTVKAATATKTIENAVEQLELRPSQGTDDKPEPDTSSSSSSSPQPVADSSQLDVSELELSQCYLDRVAHTLLQSNRRREQHLIWHAFIPSVAYGSQTVRYGMMTVAAIFLHFDQKISCNESSYSTKYVDAANFYGNTFVEQSRQQLSRLDPSETDANVACSRLLLALALAFHRQYRSDGLKYSDPAAWKWAHLLKGVKTVFLSIVSSGQTLDPVILLDMRPETPLGGDSSFLEEDTPLSPHNKTLLTYLELTQFERFAALQTMILYSSLNTDDDQRSNCLLAVQSLTVITQQVIAMNGQSIFRVLGAWIGQQPLEFIYMLENGHHAAQAIYAHWLMLLILAEDFWVIDDMGKHGIQSILDVSEGIADMDRVLHWPREALSFAQLQ